MARRAKNTSTSLAIAERRAEVIALRRKGWNFREIAEKLGTSLATAYKDYEQVIAETPVPHLEEYRAEEVSRIEYAIRNLMDIALSEDSKVTTYARIQAWNSIRDWSERKARLLGLDAPEKILSVSVDMLDQMIMQAEAETRATQAVSGLPTRAIGPSYSLTEHMTPLDAEIVSDEP